MAASREVDNPSAASSTARNSVAFWYRDAGFFASARRTAWSSHSGSPGTMPRGAAGGSDRCACRSANSVW